MSSPDRFVSSPDLRRAMEDLDMVPLEDHHSVASLLQQVLNKLDTILPRLHRLESSSELLIERTDAILAKNKPKSICVFCSSEENKDGHHSTRCTKFPDPVSRTVKATKLNLCLRCLIPEHGGDCKVTCSSCGLAHNYLLCHQKRPIHHLKRPRKQ
ncbi:hypothetical protein Y032_1465g3885 [Ancylostoma ceylanicum]|uniref:Uncharacterized protein n=1 Tax=Ancylostoma ceylanicum TaxID=53326 RepID=A0A016U8J2_9BILA|nr:hypothetical protein Y032_0052g2263 [Ancylostoma ceylanicum]EYC34777.1 hypothetical protein Y032_1465g3885 [Ancylostoma ceylanicum]